MEASKLPLLSISLNTRDSKAKQEEKFPTAHLSSVFFSSFVALALYLYAVYVLSLEEAGSDVSVERTRKGMKVILEEGDGVGVWMCEERKLIRRRKDCKYQCWEERGADVIIFQITSVQVKKAVATPRHPQSCRCKEFKSCRSDLKWIYNRAICFLLLELGLIFLIFKLFSTFLIVTNLLQ